MIDSDVLVLLPAADGRYDAMLVRGLMQLIAARRVSNIYTHVGCSNVQLAREECAHHFVNRTAHEWALWIDSDIGFTLEDYDLIADAASSVEAVCAAYRKKDQQHRIEAAWGFGFTLTSRRLFQAMADLTVPDGRPLLPRFRMRGEEWINYFPQGVLTDYDWRGEDHGFWLHARLTGLPVAIERRTRLVHVGTARYYYDEALESAAREIEARDVDVPAEPPAEPASVPRGTLEDERAPVPVDTDNDCAPD